MVIVRRRAERIISEVRIYPGERRQCSALCPVEESLFKPVDTSDASGRISPSHNVCEQQQERNIGEKIRPVDPFLVQNLEYGFEFVAGRSVKIRSWIVSLTLRTAGQRVQPIRPRGSRDRTKPVIANEVLARKEIVRWQFGRRVVTHHPPEVALTIRIRQVLLSSDHIPVALNESSHVSRNLLINIACRMEWVETDSGGVTERMYRVPFTSKVVEIDMWPR